MPLPLHSPALNFTLFAERQNLEQGLEQRLFFDPSNSPSGVFPNTISRTVTANINQQNCVDFTVYIQVSLIPTPLSLIPAPLSLIPAPLSLIPTPQFSFQHHSVSFQHHNSHSSTTQSHSNTTILIPTLI